MKSSMTARCRFALTVALTITASFRATAATSPNCQPGTGAFTACFYSGTAFNTFLLQRQDPTINFNWGMGGPYSGGPIFQFSTRWQGNFLFGAGAQRFSVTANPGARLYIDGQLVLDRWTSGPPASGDVVRQLSAGMHLVTLEFFSGWDYAYVNLSWQSDVGYRQFYVSSTGNDNNDGRTPSTAWRSTSKVSSISFQPGDHIMFEGGQSFDGLLYFAADDQGTAANPIVITSYGSGRATIRPGKTVGLLAYNTAGIEVRNLNFAGSTGNDKDGVQFYQTLPGNAKLSYIRIDSVDVSGFGSAGVSIFGGAGLAGYSDVRITNVTAHDNLRAGIWMGAPPTTAVGYAHSNVYIGNSRIYNIAGVSDIIDSGFGVFLASTDGAVVEQNVIYNNGWNTFSFGGPMGIMAMEANNITVQNNEVHHMRTACGDGGGIDFDGGVTNSTMQYNFTHDNAGSGITLAQYSPARLSFADNTVRYNISQNDGRNSISWAGIIVAGPVTKTHIYNNTIYGAANSIKLYAALIITGQTTNVDIRNNVFMTADGMQQIAVSAGQVNMQLQGNAYWGGALPLNLSWGYTNSKTLTDFRNATGQEMLNGMPAGLGVDPRFTSPGNAVAINDPSLLGTLTAYTPLAGSLLIDRGLNLATLGITPPNRDFAGAATPQGLAVDIGAIEVSAR